LGHRFFDAVIYRSKHIAAVRAGGKIATNLLMASRALGTLRPIQDFANPFWQQWEQDQHGHFTQAWRRGSSAFGPEGLGFSSRFGQKYRQKQGKKQSE
jgi:hypothetical protein